MMQITFIAHASFMLASGQYTILTDPWLTGKAFNNGWALLSPAADVPFHAVDYIWISHEHPDHFHLPTLRAISPVDKERITLLYQRHASSRLVDAFKQLGFGRIIELPIYRWYQLAPGLDVYCGSVGSIDSFLAVRDPHDCILNLNDCILNPGQLRYIKRTIGDVSILFTQFSFANWVGNYADELNEAKRKIEQLVHQSQILSPEFIVPFASFIYFCNEENQRMNAWINTPQAIHALNLLGVNFMYPGDCWNSHQRAFQSESSIKRYMNDLQRITIDSTPQIVELEKIEKAIEKCLRDSKKFLRCIAVRKAKTFDIYLHDLDKYIIIRPSTCRYQITDATPEMRRQARYVMCSQVAWYGFNFPWGFGTLAVSGMYLDRAYHTEGENPFFFYQNLLSTHALDFGGWQQAWRTLQFFWRKRGELFYRYRGAYA